MMQPPRNRPQDINSILADLRGRLDSSTARSGMTASDLFGDEITRQTDMIRSLANTTKAGLARSSMAGGGDTSGRGLASMLSVDQNANSQIGGVEGQYALETLRANMNEQQRGDGLLAGLLNTTVGQQSRTDQLAQFEKMLKLQKKQARNQLLGDVLGAAGTVGSAALLACWVAEALYGEDDERTLATRRFVLRHAEDQDALGEFIRHYISDGKEWAKMVRDDEGVRSMARAVWDLLYDMAKKDEQGGD